ncbi:MAG: DNA mismatch repair endonuclease MutL [Anaerolineae bacterium]|nr:DNA mismatch repair endonuclease MutL [Anaerolineae bacterium]
MGISILAEQVIAKIAAGEVIERPASVIKELVENSLDAGSTGITVEVDEGGRRLMKISDNGCGILAAEVPLAFARHATSKLRTAEDLIHIQTLGFRGEALASIAAVSRLTMITRHQDETTGTQIRLEGGSLTQQKSVGAPAGTVISVENLFYNTPARLKFLKADETEKRQIMTTVTRCAMAYPGVRFVLLQDGREVFRSTGSGQPGDVVVKVLGLETFRGMIEVAEEEPLRGLAGSIQVYGYVSEPGLSRKDRTRIMLFVNGRPVHDNGLTYAVTQAYHTLLMKGRHPVAVLMIQVPPEFVDVNVHPAKSEVRFQDPAAVFVAVQRTVREAVIERAQARPLRGAAGEGGRAGGWKLPYGIAPDEYVTQREMPLALDDPGQYALQRSSPRTPHEADREDPAARLVDDPDPTAIPEGPGRPQKPRTLPLLRVVGQVGAAYVVAEGPAGLYLIDQHAAHERILYEQFMARYEAQGIIAQQALEAQTLVVPPPEARLLEEKLPALAAVGFTLEPFGTNTFLIRSIPAMLADHDPVEAVLAVLPDLEADKTPGQASIEAKIILRVCKRAAVKAGQILSISEMQGIIRQLERCQSPHTCPHGRPTMLHISGDQLAREFGRLGAE